MDPYDITTEEFKKCFNSDCLVIIDVRRREEIEQQGQVPAENIIHIPIDRFEATMKLSEESFKQSFGFKKPQATDEIVFLCRSGRRSLIAINQALVMGYKKLRHFQGGILRWKEENESE